MPPSFNGPLSPVSNKLVEPKPKRIKPLRLCLCSRNLERSSGFRSSASSPEPQNYSLFKLSSSLVDTIRAVPGVEAAEFNLSLKTRIPIPVFEQVISNPDVAFLTSLIA
ncbi:hypothetical protein SLA2020_408140 [Shorea laevis]